MEEHTKSDTNNDTDQGNDQPTSAVGASPSNADAKASSASPPPMGRPITPQFEPRQAPPPHGPSKVLIGIAGAALVLVAFGVVRSIIADPEPTKPTRPAAVQTGYWHQQQQMAREAMDMAREAQQMQRERMDYMRRAMEEDYGYMEDDMDDFESP